MAIRYKSFCWVLGTTSFRTGEMNRTFATTNLDLNVISDYRGRRHQTFYDPSDRTRHIDGMKIMPIDTKMLRRMLERRLKYSTIYKMFDDHFNRDGDPASWHDDLRAAIDNV